MTVVSEQSVYEALSQVLNNPTQSNEQNLARLAEVENFPLITLQIALNTKAPLAQRQMSLYVLKNYIDSHWSNRSDKFVDLETRPSVKDAVRLNIVQGLSDPVTKVRIGVAYAIARIAQYDWPEEWPSLFDTLIMHLKSACTPQVHGAMQVLAELLREDINDQQFPLIAQSLLPELHVIFGNGQYAAETRAQCLSILRDCVEMLYSVKEEYPQAVETYFAPILPIWLQTFHIYVQHFADTSMHSIYLYVEIIKTISSICDHFPKLVDAHLNQFLEPVISLISKLMPRYAYEVIEGHDCESVIDEGSYNLGLHFYTLFEFVNILARKKSMRAYFVNSNQRSNSVLSHLIPMLICSVKISAGQEDFWMEDVRRFVADEDDDASSVTVRQLAVDLMSVSSFTHTCCLILHQTLVEKFEDDALLPLMECGLHSLSNAVLKNDWKTIEAVLFILGQSSTEIVSSASLKLLNANLIDFMSNALSQFVNPGVNNILRGRALWFAVQFSELQLSLVQQFLNTTVSILLDSPSPTITYALALKTLQIYCQKYPMEVKVHQCSIISNICRFTDAANENLLYLLLDSLQLIISIDKQNTSSVLPTVVPLLIGLWSRHIGDPLTSSTVVDLLESLCDQTDSYMFLLSQIGPVYVSLLSRYNPNDANSIEAAAGALDLLSLLVKKSPGPLNADLLSVISSTMNFLVQPHVSDVALLQNGLELLKFLTENNLETLVEFNVGQRSFIDVMVDFVLRVLDPSQTTESGAILVGDVLLRLAVRGYKYPTIRATFQSIVQTCLARLSSGTSSVWFIQSLLPMFMSLIDQDCGSLVEYLASTGELDVFIRCWFDNYLDCHSYFLNRLSVSALCKLLSAQYPRITTILVKGDRIDEEPGRIVTRSRARVERWTEVSAPVKALKLLIAEYMSEDENETVIPGVGDLSADTSFEADEDDDEDWEDLGMIAKNVDDINEEREDALWKSETAYSIMIKPFIRDFLKQFASHADAALLAHMQQSLTAEEHQQLSKIMSS